MGGGEGILDHHDGIFMYERRRLSTMGQLTYIPYIENVENHCIRRGVDHRRLSDGQRKTLERLEVSQWNDLSDYLSEHMFDFFYGGGLTHEMIDYLENPSVRLAMGGYSGHPNPELYHLMEGIQHGGARPLMTEPDVISNLPVWQDDPSLKVLHPQRTLGRSLDLIDRRIFNNIVYGEASLDGHGFRGKAIATIIGNSYPDTYAVAAFVPSHLGTSKELTKYSIPHRVERMPSLQEIDRFLEGVAYYNDN